jgi:hypothetical protein
VAVAAIVKAATVMFGPNVDLFSFSSSPLPLPLPRATATPFDAVQVESPGIGTGAKVGIGVEIAIAVGVAVVAVVLFRRQHNDIHDSSQNEMQCMVSLEPEGGFINEDMSGGCTQLNPFATEPLWDNVNQSN